MPAAAAKTAARRRPTQSSSKPTVAAAAANARPLADKFHPADPKAPSLHPFPPNQRPKFELFDPADLLALATCQRDAYTEKLTLMDERRLDLRARHRGRDWSHEALVDYAHIKVYRRLLGVKMTFWEGLYHEAYQNKVDMEAIASD